MYDKRIAEPEFAALIEKKRKNLRTANKVIGGLGCGGTVFGGIFWILMTAGITAKLGLPALIVCLFAIPAVFRLHAKTGKHRALLQTVRAAGIALIACVLLAPYLCASRKSERIPLLYPLKHFVFQCGVMAYPYQDTVLPLRLPKQHDDYVFRTEPGMVAQDYHPYEYLFLHTDTDTLRAYENRLSGDPDFERQENRSYSPEELKKMLENYEIASEAWADYQNIPYWMYSMIREYADMPDDLSNAVIYQCGRCGAVINEATGLLVLWG